MLARYIRFCGQFKRMHASIGWAGRATYSIIIWHSDTMTDGISIKLDKDGVGRSGLDGSGHGE